LSFWLKIQGSDKGPINNLSGIMQSVFVFVFLGSFTPAVAESLQTCDSQLNNQACAGQFGNEECYTCGQRITYFQSAEGGGKSESLARQLVGNEFFADCGACAANGDNFQLSTSGYAEVWRDDFDGDGPVDGSKWEHIHEGTGFGNNEEQFYTNRQENSWVSDGTLKIKAVREDFGGRRYTSAKLQTRADWLYGKFSVRARLNRGVGRGTWAANWMMPRQNTYGAWPHSGEIDIMEHVGYDTGKVHGTVHTGCCHHSIGTQVGGQTNADVGAWHTYTVEWRPDVMLFAMDGDVYKIYSKTSDESSQWPFNHNFYIILNMAVGGDWGGQDGIDEGAFSGEGQIMEIDWVVVEQTPSDGFLGGADRQTAANLLRCAIWFTASQLVALLLY
jgi:beta-glucanase (GH16 family)